MQNDMLAYGIATGYLGNYGFYYHRATSMHGTYYVGI